MLLIATARDINFEPKPMPALIILDSTPLLRQSRTTLKAAITKQYRLAQRLTRILRFKWVLIVVTYGIP